MSGAGQEVSWDGTAPTSGSASDGLELRPLDVEEGATTSRGRSHGARPASRGRSRSASRGRSRSVSVGRRFVLSVRGDETYLQVERSPSGSASAGRSLEVGSGDPSERGVLGWPSSSPPREEGTADVEASASDPAGEVPALPTHPELTGTSRESEESSCRRSPGQSRPPPLVRSFSTGLTTYHVATRPYRGFSTPFCGMFRTTGGLLAADADAAGDDGGGEGEDGEASFREREIRLSNFRTDLCSLPCFGILQSDYTRFLMTHTRPPTLFKRACLHAITPLGLFCLAGWFAGHIRQRVVNSVVCTALVYWIICWIFAACFRGRKKRVMVREEVLFKLRQRQERIERRLIAERRRREGAGVLGLSPSGGGLVPVETEEYEYYSDDESEYIRSDMGGLGQTRYEMNCAHRMLGCYPSDVAPGEGEDERRTSDYQLQRDGSAGAADGEDLCTRAWSCLSRPCLPCFPFGGAEGSRGCHLQWCGLCALAQEGREANLTLPRHLRMVDYVTMEPFLMYYPRIVELRKGAAGGLADHMRALSGFSTLLLKSLLTILAVLLGLSLTSALRGWEFADFAVLVGTFVQALSVLVFVHWGFHRHDLSVDAVIKYFAAGFALSSCMSFTVEAAEFLAFKGAVNAVIWLCGVEEVEDDGYGGMRVKLATSATDGARRLSGSDDVLNGFFERNPAAKFVYVLLSSFLLAGLVQELSKFFGFAMVDHPDFASERELRKAKATMPFQIQRHNVEDDSSVGTDGKSESRPATPRTPTTLDGSIASFDPASQRRSLASVRGGVTCAMVAVALGFACFENILHIFVYNRSSLTSEVVVLVAKSLFPIHPIFAAIQSVYVCRRDLERDRRVGLGRIVLPSMIIHGTYDLVLLLITSSWERTRKDLHFYNGDGGLSEVATRYFSASLFMVLVGLAYYAKISRAQYKRLSDERTSFDMNDAKSGLLL